VKNRRSFAEFVFIAILLRGGSAALAADSLPPAVGQSSASIVRKAPGDTTKIGARLSSARTAATQGDSWTATTTTGAPSAPVGYTAVWTGSRMIVWGGSSPNDGGQYDPVADAWTATTTTNAPSARGGHTAVWTGSRMIVWGGSSPNDGGQYDPVADAWTATTTTNAPSARGGYTAVWTGTRLIVWGGWNGFTYFNDGGQYDPVADAWTATTPTGAPGARGFHTAVWTGSRMIVWGGRSGNSLLTIDKNDGSQYDPVGNTWTATATTGAPGLRSEHTAVWTGTRMIVWGGIEFVNGSTSRNDGGQYDPASDAWTPTTTTGAPSARSAHTVVWTGSRMVVWGGIQFVNGSTGLNDGGQYDPASDAWTPTTTTGAPSARSGHTAVWTSSRMIVWGGWNGTTLLKDGGQWAPASAAGCTEDALTMCLIGGRYKVTSYWRNQYAGGATSNLNKAHLTDATGAFWLSDANTYEYLIRINTATNNGRAWIAIPTFTDVEFWIQVQDTVNGQAQTYHSPAGNKTLIYDPYFFVYP
jgi:N-acetylneuraminic acid mutarotase